MSIVTLTNQKRQAPWIGIGVRGEWTDYREALYDSGLDFKVRQEELFWQKEIEVGSGVYVNEPTNHFANVRNTDDRVLGYVTAQYGIVQNSDAFQLLEPFTKAGGIITNAGMTEQGLVFMVLHLRNQEFLGDEYSFDVMCCNSFNTAFPLSLIMTPMRIICQNMYRALMGTKGDALLHLRHGSQAEHRLKAASRAAGAIGDYIDAFGCTLERAEGKCLTANQTFAMVEMLFPYPKPGGPREMTSRERVDAMRSEFMTKYYEAPDNRKFHGTGMGFLNAYYDYLSHREPTKDMPGSWKERKLSGLVSGNDIKAKLIERSMK